jgi:hypothetical protein
LEIGDGDLPNQCHLVPQSATFSGMVQKHPLSGNIWSVRADPDRSRVGSGLCNYLVGAPWR